MDNDDTIESQKRTTDDIKASDSVAVEWEIE